MLKETGVFATPEQRDEIEKAITRANETPVMMMCGHDVAAVAWRQVQNLCHAMALKNGLPDRETTYSYNRETGEFFKEDDHAE